MHKRFLRVWGSPSLVPSPESTLALGSSLWPQDWWNSSLPARKGTGGPRRVPEAALVARPRSSKGQEPQGKWEPPAARRLPQSGRGCCGFDPVSFHPSFLPSVGGVCGSVGVLTRGSEVPWLPKGTLRDGRPGPARGLDPRPR